MKALVTGGGGFLGRRLVELLLQQGDEVTVVARSRYPEVEALGAKCAQVDLRDKGKLVGAVQGHDVVFHVASRTGFWGKRGANDYWAINVDGTNNLLEVMEAVGVNRLVYTSTPSVVGYAQDVQNGPQDLPYADPHESIYPESKAAAEAEVLRANNRTIATVSLRPHLIFGPCDNHLVPRLVERGAAGKLPIIGDGTAKVDVTYIDNAAWAHIDAANALISHEAPCAGRPYFIGNEQPVVLYDWINEILEGLGHPPVTKKLSRDTARKLAAAMEWAWNNLPLPGEPRLTPFLIDGFARHHWYDPEPARRDLGYEPRVSMDEAMKRTIGWLKERE